MAQVFFTQHLRRLVPYEPVEVSGDTIASVLDGIFDEIPALKSYVVDDQGALRKHVCIFVDEERIDFTGSLTHPVGAESEVYIMQALSGGMRCRTGFL